MENVQHVYTLLNYYLERGTSLPLLRYIETNTPKKLVHVIESKININFSTPLRAFSHLWKPGLLSDEEIKYW